MTRIVLVLSLLLALPATVAAEPIERRLLRTIQTGTLQGLTVAEIVEYAKGDKADFLGHILARSALLVLGKDGGFPDWPVWRLLDRTLNQLQRRSPAYNLPPEIPARFGGEDLVFTVVYAMVVSGEAEKAIDVLKPHVGSANRFRQGVALQALRNIGSPRANAVIQGVADRRDNRNLAQNLLADHHYPFLLELVQRLPLVPPDQRGRHDLLRAAQDRCTQKAALAVYFLGFLAEATDRAQTEAELRLLRELTAEHCFYTRFFAIRALALRSVESVEFWTGLFKKEKDAWQRAQLARIGFGRFGKEFTEPALKLLADEPVQYVQWELMHGNLEVRRGVRFRDYWDIWLPPSLQFRLNFPDGRGRMTVGDVEELLAWLESGARPKNPWVRNHMLHGLAKQAAGPLTRRLLRIFDSLPDKTSHWWILTPLRDPVALPILRYWRTLVGDKRQRDQLVRLITILEGVRPGSRGGGPGICCQPTRECLLFWVRAVPAAGEVHEITTPEQAKAWLEGADDSSPLDVRFVDSLGRVANVTRRGADPERWEHLYGCWRRLGPVR